MMSDGAGGTVGGPRTDDPFDAYYFAHCCGVPYRRDAHWQTFFGGIAEHIVQTIQPRRVLDAGCALGILVEALRARGVDAEGIDVSSYAIEHVYEPMRPFCRLGSIADEFSGRYDLIISIEVLEHMPPREGEAAIANVCRHTDDVLFSSTPADYRELSHVNVQPAEYWAELFARHGFYRDVDFDASFLNPWAVRFRRSSEPAPRIVRGYERRYAALAAAQNDARQYSLALQRELATAQERAKTLETEVEQLRHSSDGPRAALEAERAALQRVIAQLGELAVALDHQRCALLDSRMDLDRERERVAREAETDRAALTAELRAAVGETRRLMEAADDQRAKAAQHAEAERQQALEAADAERESLTAALREALEETHAHLTRKVLEVDAVKAQLADVGQRAQLLEHDVRHARETIQLMEQSVFWRARRPWAVIKRTLGRRG